jgi:hypothetical protein
MRAITRLVVALTLVLGTFSSIPTANAHHRDGPCDFHWHTAYYENGSTWGVRRIIRCAARRWDVSVTTALRVARCESGFRPDAYGNGNAGVFQHRLAYWSGRAERYLRDRWHLSHNVYNARGNVIVSIRMARAGGWSPWSCY